MVSNVTLLHIHQWLKEIFATPNNQLFAGLSIIVVGYLYQLPPIRSKPVFDEYKNDVHNLCHPWSVFSMIELTKIMRQKDDQLFTQLLNRFIEHQPNMHPTIVVSLSSWPSSKDKLCTSTSCLWSSNPNNTFVRRHTMTEFSSND